MEDAIAGLIFTNALPLLTTICPDVTTALAFLTSTCPDVTTTSADVTTISLGVTTASAEVTTASAGVTTASAGVAIALGEFDLDGSRTSRLSNPASLDRRVDTGEEGRFRKFSRDWIAERGDNLDIAWLRDENGGDNGELPEPAILAQEAIGELEAAIAELQGILQELGEDISL